MMDAVFKYIQQKESLEKEKRDISKQTVIEFNNSIIDNIDEEKMRHFFEVTEFIKSKVEHNELISIK